MNNEENFGGMPDGGARLASDLPQNSGLMSDINPGPMPGTPINNNPSDENMAPPMPVNPMGGNSFNPMSDPMMNAPEGLGQPMGINDLPQGPANYPKANVSNRDGSKKKIILPLIITLILLAVASAGVYLFLKSQSRNMIITRSFEHLQASFNKNTELALALPKIAEYSQSSQITLNASSSNTDIATYLKEFNNYLINYDLEKRNDSLYVALDLKNNNQSIFNLKALGQNNKLYLAVEQIFSKVLEFDYETDALVKDDYISYEDYLYLYQTILKTTMLNITDDSLAQEKTTINLDGKSVKVNKTTVALDQGKLIQLGNNVINDLKADARANEILNKISPDFKDFKFTSVHIPATAKLKYSVYSSGLFNKVVGVDLEFDDGEFIAQYRAETNDTIYLIDENNNLKLVFKKTTNKLDIVIYDNTNQVAEIVIESNNSKNLNVSLEAKIEGASYVFNWTTIVEELTAGKEYKINNAFKITATEAGSDMSFEIKADILLKDISNATASSKLDITNAVKYENLTEAELTEISNKMIQLILGGALTQSDQYLSVNNYNEFKSLTDRNQISVMVFGRASCPWCSKYKEVLNTVALNNGTEIYFVDSDALSTTEYNKIINSGLQIPAACNNGKAAALTAGFGVPLTLFVKNGKTVDCISGYVEADVLLNKLTANKLVL